ncbi:5-formyltetrahydrofolate cyclo-ligase [Brevibacillus laterosporus]|uniref:5-formyltetrahydrofolate cyclo-ligase n=1 Tax=Brevibacillus laterosporus TaxID=1465 RepID=UPI0018F8B7AA|nr:5-formyltetrahydrofolate cyclo-ligase [Brevibacillus laterosporus]MBG9773601.1 5-formyltetrahydrofolate cyclo-ligase [Brevibacillus laterosporus]
MNIQEKKYLRQVMISERDLLSKEACLQKSAKATQHLWSISAVKDAQTIMCFSSFGSEINTWSFIEEARERQIKVALPLTDREHKKITPYTYEGRNSLKKGAYGIWEPDTLYSTELKLADIEVVIVPGVAFDQQKGRLGYGAGYYDRFFASLSHEPRRIGFCFAMQVIEKVPMEPFDIHLHQIVTEDGII